MNEEIDVLRAIKRLTVGQRDDAWKVAQAKTIERLGTEPRRRDFGSTDDSTYPPFVLGLNSVLLVVVLIAGFIVSAIRMYTLAYGELLNQLNPIVPPATVRVIDDATMATAALGAAALTALSEGALFVFMIAMVVSISKSVQQAAQPDRNVWQRIGDWIVANLSRAIYLALSLMSALLAITANITVAVPTPTPYLFAYIEAIVPPLVVIGVGYALKDQMLAYIKHYANVSQQYDAAMAAYNENKAHPETSRHWIKFYATALRDAINKAHEGNPRATGILRNLTTPEWTPIILRELADDNWAETLSQPSQRPSRPARLIRPSETPSRRPGFTVNGTGQAVPIQGGESGGDERWTREQFYEWYDQQADPKPTARSLDGKIPVPRSTIQRWLDQREVTGA